MKGYSQPEEFEHCATARLEGVNASYKDLAQVCGRIRGKNTEWALSFLERAANEEIPVLYKRHNKNLGHRRELGGKKGRYPWKAAKIVLMVLESAMANGKTLGLGNAYVILAASANKKQIFPRMASKGRQARSNLETSRVEIVLKGDSVPRGVTVSPPVKKEDKKEEKKVDSKKAEKKEITKSAEKAEESKSVAPVIGKEEKKQEPTKLLDEEAKQHEHKHEMEKALENETKRKEKVHEHGEHSTR